MNKRSVLSLVAIGSAVGLPLVWSAASSNALGLETTCASTEPPTTVDSIPSTEPPGPVDSLPSPETSEPEVLDGGAGGELEIVVEDESGQSGDVGSVEGTLPVGPTITVSTVDASIGSPVDSIPAAGGEALGLRRPHPAADAPPEKENVTFEFVITVNGGVATITPKGDTCRVLAGATAGERAALPRYSAWAIYLPALKDRLCYRRPITVKVDGKVDSEAIFIAEEGSAGGAAYTAWIHGVDPTNANGSKVEITIQCKPLPKP